MRQVTLCYHYVLLYQGSLRSLISFWVFKPTAEYLGCRDCV